MTKPEHLLDQIADRSKQQFGSLPDWQSLIKHLRAQEGCSKAESIFILSRHFAVPYQDALEAVHNSPHWSNRKESDDQLNAIMWKAPGELETQGNAVRMSDIRFAFVENMSLPNGQLAPVGKTTVKISAAVWTVWGYENFMDTCVGFMRISLSRLRQVHKELNIWLLVADRDFQPDSRITKYYGMWKKLERDHPFLKTAERLEFAHESEKKVRRFGAARIEPENCGLVFDLMAGGRACLALLGRDDRKVVEELARSGWDTETAKPPKRILEEVCVAGGIVVDDFSQFSGPEICVSAFGREEQILPLHFLWGASASKERSYSGRPSALNGVQLHAGLKREMLQKFEEAHGFALPSDHCDILMESNGVEAYGGYIRVFGIGCSESADSIRWNREDHWKFAWNGRCSKYWCVAETAWGDQYAYDREELARGKTQIYLLEAFTMMPTPIEPNFRQFYEKEFLRIAAEPYDPTIPLAREKFGDLEITFHLAYDPPLFLGEKTDMIHVVKMDARLAMIQKGDMAIQITGAPPGSKLLRTETYEDDTRLTRIRLVWA